MASFLIFLLIITRSCLPTRIRLYVCTSKSQIVLCISLSWVHSGLCIYHLVASSNFSFLHKSQWITFSNQLYSSYTPFLLIYYIHLCEWLFRLCHHKTDTVVYYWYWLQYNWSLFCAVIRKGLVSLSKFPFHKQVHVLCAIYLIFLYYFIDFYIPLQSQNKK